MKEWTSVSDIIYHVRTLTNPKALNEDKQGEWVSISSEEALLKIEYLTLAFDELGIKKGDSVGIMSPPCIEWTLINMALLIKGAVVVPLFPNISEENFLFEIKETQTHLIFVKHHYPIPILDSHGELFKKIVEMGQLDELYERGKKLALETPKKFDELLQQVKENDLCTIIYTSATTGMPKGVMLTQRNLVGHLFDIPVVVDTNARYLNIIPLAHIFGYTLNALLFGWGGGIYYSADPKNFVNDCKAVKPTLTAVVPRLLEKLRLGFVEKINSAKGLKKIIGSKALEVAYSKEPGWLYRALFPIWDKLIYSKIRAALGDSFKMVISGGAPLDPRLNYFYQNLGIPVREGWGLTEACPVTVNSIEPGANKVGTVGPPFNGWKIRIGADGEVLVKGSGVMLGYHNNPELTAKAIDDDGWLHTGDKGTIDKDGYLTILGRIKELYKTSTGEWVAPVPIEQMLCNSPFIEQAMVIAEGRKFASALLFPNLEVLERLKKENNATHLSNDEFLNTPLIKQKVADHIEEINNHLNHWEQVHAFRFIATPPSIEAGEMTPSMKLKREVVRNKYQHLIDAMYAEETV